MKKVQIHTLSAILSKRSGWGLLCLTFGLMLSAVCAVAQTDAKPALIAETVARQFIKYKVDPEYPATARQFRIAGDVVAQITISAEGKVESVDEVKGNQILKPPVTTAVKKWIFNPILQDGKPARVRTTITFLFKM